MRAVCYCRVSSQAQRERHTIDSQLRELPLFIERMGWELTQPPRHYVDDGRSAKAGKLEERLAFQRLLADAALGQFDIVAVVDLDRLTRSEDITERGQVLGAFQRAGVRLAISSTGQVLDLRSSIGDLLSSLGGFFAAEENRKRRERTVRGKYEAILKGRKPSGPTPYGYRYSKATGEWSVHPGEAELVREIYRRISRGESSEAISLDFDQRGLVRPRGGRWIRERIWQIAVASTYRGEWRADKRKSLAIKVPPIVDDELWHAAQAALTRFKRRGLRRTKHIYLCEGIAACALCGARIGINSTGWGKDRVAYYMCGHRRRPPRGKAPCKLPMRRVSEVDGKLWTAVTDLLLRPDHLERALMARRSDAGEQHDLWESDLKQFERKLAQHEHGCSNIMDAHRRGLIPDNLFAQHLQDAERERRMLVRQVETAKRQVEAARADEAGLKQLVASAAGLKDLLAEASPKVRQEFVQALVPGGEHVVRLGATEIEAQVLVAAAVSRFGLVNTSD